MEQATLSPTRHPRGGPYFEDFPLGHLFEHRLTRTVTQMDNMLFSNMTLNPQPLHIDRHFCEQETEWGQPIMNSLFTLGLMIGISVNDLTVGTTIANLGMTEVKFPHPLFEGDTVHCTTEILGKRPSKSRPGAGIVEFYHRAYNQNDKLVAECQRQAFMRMQQSCVNWPCALCFSCPASVRRNSIGRSRAGPMHLLSISRARSHRAARRRHVPPHAPFSARLRGQPSAHSCG